MSVRSLLTQGYETLFYAEVQTPFLDAVVLLAHAMVTTKEKLLALLPDDVPPGVETRFRDFLDRRCSGVPVSYIRRAKEFYGLEFYVDERVLVPRPETEVVVEKILQCVRAEPRLRRVHDACTGSGCIGIAVKSAAPGLEVSASDISAPALEVAAMNADRLLEGTIPAYRSDLLDSVPGSFDLIASNPPYLRDDEVADLRKLGGREPELALAGGGDGTALAERLIRSAPARLSPGGWLVLEAAPLQITRLYAFMDQAGFHTIDVEQDLAGSSRVIAGRLSPSVAPPPFALHGDERLDRPATVIGHG
ncbi:MAG: peptide chain release factor N(5)-glutamine methyltransferase [Spirochaetia bacterium]|jgi:release factor glutamine methyltransferase